ncbi:terminase small subunit [Candidatus Peribacteria bacterium]|nr:terminase small subunit [Candidatus Peribacteria bacterium]
MKPLNRHQRLFCHHFVTTEYGNATRAYMAAYEKTEDQYIGAKKSAHRLLQNPDVLAYIQELLALDDRGKLLAEMHLMKLVYDDSDPKMQLQSLKLYFDLQHKADKDTPANEKSEQSDSQRVWLQQRILLRQQLLEGSAAATGQKEEEHQPRGGAEEDPTDEHRPQEEDCPEVLAAGTLRP